MSETLGSLCKFLNGGTPSRDVESYFQGNIPWITSADIVAPTVTTARSFITPSAIENSATNKVAPGTILLVTRTSVGKVATADVELCFSQDITAILPDVERLHGGFLVHFLKTKQGHFDRFARGATIKGITRDVVADLKIPLPPLPEQHRIAAILDKTDALRTKRREALAQLDSLAQSIFLEMFGDPVTNPSALPVVPLLDIACGGFQNGAYFPKERYSSNGIEMVHMSDAFGGVVKRGNLKRVACEDEEISKYALNENDILIARRSLTYDGAAKPCRVPKSKHPLIFESSFIRIRPDLSKTTSAYLFHYLNSERVREKFVRPYVTQSTISGINQANLSRIPLMLPPLESQDRFSIQLEAIHRVRMQHIEALRLLDALFGAFQHRAFQGEL